MEANVLEETQLVEQVVQPMKKNATANVLERKV
jgi:hypothetical protein